MNTIKYIFILACLLNCMSCFEDKGNYDYGKIYTIGIKLPNSVTMVVNESRTFKPELTFDEKNPAGVRYEWQIESKVVSHDSVYTHLAKELGSLRGLLTVEDEKTGAKFYKEFSIEVKPLYEMGFLLLTENGENSDLGFVKAGRIPSNSQTGTNDTVVYIADYINCYSDLYGEPINGKPLQLREHYAFDDYNRVFGEVTVKTALPERNQFMELNGESLKKETFIEEEFSNGLLPVAFHPVDLLHTCFDSFLLDKDGLLYTRRCNPATGYHLGYFSKDVVYLGGKRKISNIIFSDYVESGTIYAIEEDAAGKKRYLGIYSDYYSNRRNLTEMELVYEEEEFAAHFTDLTDEVMESDYFRVKEEGVSGSAVVSKSPEGEYMLHLFVGGAPSSAKHVKIYSSQKINLTREHGITDFVKLGTFRNCNMVYVCDKQNIYYFEVDETFHKYEFGIVRTFDKEIVSMATQSMFGYGAKSFEHHIGVAFKDGFFDIYELQYDGKDMSSLYKFSNKVYGSTRSFGKIRDVIWKLGVGNYYFNGR
ncbi:hypothetical protein DMB45_13100 [Sanguibacteroides justesenii]|uniref:PKD-like family lipoprotein n=1 Tax=Sanguibacteroides justesenii TaxID=1547597 RepID=UPI000D9AE612|nr:PKD-like family lipoprotein [Sanguibacteroides justesenii]PXZ42915.1 hypothetical protein DMB45_13100 [Sanguibacteroides justesenii]